jgi:hypothetical protein
MASQDGLTVRTVTRHTVATPSRFGSSRRPRTAAGWRKWRGCVRSRASQLGHTPACSNRLHAIEHLFD